MEDITPSPSELTLLKAARDGVLNRRSVLARGLRLGVGLPTLVTALALAGQSRASARKSVFLSNQDRSCLMRCQINHPECFRPENEDCSGYKRCVAECPVIV